MSKVVIGKFGYTAVNVTTVWTLVLAVNARRKFATITNASDTDMWLKCFNGAPTGGAGTGVFVAKAGFSYTIDNDNMWLGEVYCIHGGAGNKVASIEDGE